MDKIPQGIEFLLHMIRRINHERIKDLISTGHKMLSLSEFTNHFIKNERIREIG